MFIADRNVYGIDLNPVAVELAEVSLWLNTIYEGGFVPWFGTQLVNGNSLIGARRQVYRIENAQSTSKGLRWYEMEPDRVPLGTKRMPKKQVYHFLLGDPGMCSYTDKVIKQLEPANIKEMKDWNKKFTSPFTDDEVVTLLRLSAVIDELWEAQIQLRKEVGSKTQDALSIFGYTDDAEDSHTNPPWIKIEWNEQSVLSDTHPMFAVKKLTATQTTHKRAEALENAVTRKMYFSEYEMLSGEQAFLNAVQNYADLKGQQTNLFKCFLPQSWMYNSKSGVAAFVHPEGVYDDPKGGALREKLYPRLRYHFQFANERKLFPEVDHHTQFSLNVYGGPLMVSFDTISNLYDAKSIVECYEGDAAAPIPGIKDEDGDWNVKGHPDRVIHVTKKELAVFAKLFDGNDNWKQAKLPQLHAKQLIETLECFADSQITVGSLEQKVFTTTMWEETSSQDKGLTKRDVHFPESTDTLIYSGPHIGVANPLFKTSRRICRLNSDYDNLDLLEVDSHYLQRYLVS